MVQSHSGGQGGSVSRSAFKAYVFFPFPVCACSWIFWAGRKKIVVLRILHSFVPWSSEVRENESKSELTETGETWLECVR